MTKKETTRVDAATPRGSETQVNIPSKNHITTSHRIPQAKIAPLLGRGRNEALTARQLAEMLGMTERQVTLAVRHDRLICRIPILSATYRPFGFFLPDSDPEIAKTQIAEQRENLKRRTLNTMALLRVFSPGELEGQKSFFGGENGQEEEPAE